MSSSQIILIHSLIHILICIKFLAKEGLTLRSFIWPYLSVFTVAGYFILKTGIYEIVMDSSRCSESEKISWVPYALNIIFTYILVNPLGRIRASQFEISLGRVTKKGTNIFSVSLFLCVLFMCLKLYQVLVVASIGFGNFHDIGSSAQRAFLYGGNPLLFLINYAGRVVNICVVPFLITYLLIRWRNNSYRFSKLFLFYILYAINTISVGLVAGSRASMVYGFLDVAFFALLFSEWFPKRVKIIGVLLCSVILLGAVSLFTNIGDQRFEGVSAEFNFLSYLGQSYLNLGFEFWNHLQVYTYGSITMGKILGVEVGDYFITTGVHDDWFHTAYGSLFEDFGPIIPIILALLLSKVFSRYINNGKSVGLEKIIGILFYFQICYQIPFGLAFDFFYLFTLLLIVMVPKYLRIIFLRS